MSSATSTLLISNGVVVGTGSGEAISDVLIDGDRIVSVDARIEVDPTTPRIDATGMIVSPGLQDTHRHCWQTQMRRFLADADIARYFEVMHATVGPACVPDDIYAGNLLAALTALDGGVTTLLDFSHNCRSAAHTDAAIAGLTDAGVRAVFAYGAPLVGDWDRQWPDDIGRVVDLAGRSGGLISVRSAVLADAGMASGEVVLSECTIRDARGAGVGIIADAAIGPSTSANVLELGASGFLGPDVTLIHCTDLSDEAWRVIGDSGVLVSLCPTSDMQIGLGDARPPIRRVIEHGVPAGLSVDVECCLSSDLFAQMQAIYSVQRMEAFGAPRTEGSGPEPMSVRDVFELATVGGATVNGLGGRVGRVAPGQLADLVLIRADDLNTMPLNDPVATVVLGTGPQNVDTVIVGGRVVKAGGVMLDRRHDELRQLVYQSRDRILARTGLAPRWVQ